MPTFTHGSYAELGLDPAGGTSYTDVSEYLNDMSPSQDIDAAETTTFGNGTKTYIPGLEDATFSLSGFWDPTIDGMLSSMKRVQFITFRYRPAGTGAGLPEYTGDAILTSYNIGSTVDDALSFEGELQVSGGLQRAVQS